MDKEFFSILDGVLGYEKKQPIIVSIGFIIVVAIIALSAIKQFKKNSFLNGIIILIIAVTLCIVFAGYLMQNKAYQNNVQLDMDSNTVITYHGEFIHDNYQKDSFYHNVYILDDTEKKVILRYPDYANIHSTYSNFREMPVGSFTGTIIYSKNSKIILSWNIETGSQ